MRKLTIVLLGVLFGQMLMLPAMYKLYKLPLLKTHFVDIRDKDYTTTKPVNYLIKDVSSVLRKNKKEKKDLKIHIRTQADVIEAYENLEGEKVLGLLGYYNPDAKGAHAIYSVNSVAVVIHEMRHIFEGYFHRKVPDDDESIRFTKCIIGDVK